MKLPEKKVVQPKAAGKKPQEKERITPEYLEAEFSADTNEMLESFKERAKAENVRLLDATDSEYWFAVCFQTREMKEEFLQKAGLLHIGDKYLDGLKVAKAMGIKLESPVPPNRKISKFGGAYLDRIIK